MEINSTISLTLFNEKEVQSFDSDSIDDILARTGNGSKKWVHFNNIVDVDSIRKVFSEFGIPEPILLDITEPTRFEKHETLNGLFFVKFHVKCDSSVRSDLRDEHVSFIVGEDFIVTIEEKGIGLLQLIRDKLKNGKSNATGKSTGFLFYKMLKLCVIDKYFEFFAMFIDLHEKAEEEVLSRYTKRTLPRILNLRKQILPFREYLIELDNVNDILMDEESPLMDLPDQQSIKESIFRRVEDMKETLTDLRRWNTEIMDIYRANVNEKMERVMRTLTIFSSIFLPLTFITGFYGMNFGYLPLLEKEYGYIALSGLMLLIAGSMLIYMKRRKWY